MVDEAVKERQRDCSAYGGAVLYPAGDRDFVASGHRLKPMLQAKARAAARSTARNQSGPFWLLSPGYWLLLLLATGSWL